MTTGDDIVRQMIQAIDESISATPVNLVQLKSRLISLLEYLSSPVGRTDENCRAVDSYFCIEPNWPAKGLPQDFHDLLADIGGVLHDTVSHPDIAGNFDSTPEQLLERARRLNTEEHHGTMDTPDPRKEKRAKSDRRMDMIGWILIVVIVLGGFWWFMNRASKPKEVALRAFCANNLQSLGKACKLYDMDNDGHLPTNWVSMATYCANEPRLFICSPIKDPTGTIETVDQWCDFVLVPGLTTNDPPDAILAYDRLRNHREEGGNVLFLNGKVEWHPAKDFRNLRTKVGKALSDK